MADPTKLYIQRNVADYSGNPADNELLAWNSAGSYFEPIPFSDYDLADLGNVGLGTPDAGDILTYTGAAWLPLEPATPDLGIDELNNVDITSPVNESILKYNSSSGSWVDAAHTLNNIANVNAASPNDGDGIYYDSGISRWVSGPPPSSGSDSEAPLMHVFNEAVSGTGTNFDTAYVFIENSLQVTWNGVRQSADNFTEKVAKDGFTTGFTVDSGDELLVDYVRSSSGSLGVSDGNASHLQGRLVATTAPANGEGLVWSSSNNRWQPGTVGGGGSGSGYYTIWDPDCPPESANEHDDEFDDGSVTGWTEFDHGSRGTLSEDATGLKITVSGAGSDSIVAALKAVPTSGSYSITTKVGLTGKRMNYLCAGLCIAEGTGATDDLVGFYYQFRDNTHYIEVSRFSQYNTFNTSYKTDWDGAANYPRYLRIRTYNNDLFFDLSPDGISWEQIYTRPMPFTEAYMGLMVNNVNTAHTGIGRFQFFRVREDSYALIDVLDGRERIV